MIPESNAFRDFLYLSGSLGSGDFTDDEQGNDHQCDTDRQGNDPILDKSGDDIGNE